MKIDPRMFITGPFRPCPACGAPQFGTLTVSGHHVTRRCRDCWHTSTQTLPELDKRVIYLDQNILSNMAKALDSVWQSGRPEDDEIWLRVYDALERVVKLQLAVCPSSPTHEKESSVTAHFNILKRLYGHLSQGVEFEYPVLVYGIQVTRAFESTLGGEPVDYGTIGRDEVLRGTGDINSWASRLRITAEFPPTISAEELRTIRYQSAEAWERNFRRWADEQASFEEVYAFERQGMVESALASWYTHMEALRRYMLTGVMTEEALNPKLEVEVVNSLVSLAERASDSREEALERAVEFMKSEPALDAPMNDLSALLFAALARRAASGQKRAPGGGMWNDIFTISAYLPYCDAMFIDNECAQLLDEGPLDGRVEDHPVRIFSKRTLEGFVDYLQELEALARSDHRELVVEVYGDSWLTPYRTLLADEREREEGRRNGR